MPTEVAKPAYIPVYFSLDRDRLVELRKASARARENWTSIKGESDAKLLAREEISRCTRVERACTQVIEYIDGKRPSLGVLTGDDRGALSYRVPPEMVVEFRLCLAIASL